MRCENSSLHSQKPNSDSFQDEYDRGDSFPSDYEPIADAAGFIIRRKSVNTIVSLQVCKERKVESCRGGFDGVTFILSEAGSRISILDKHRGGN